MHEFTCVGVYLGIDIHKITLSTLVGYHIGYLVDLASSLCLSFLFLFSFSFAYEYAKLSKYVCVHRSALLSSHVFFNTNKRSFDHRQCRFSSPLFVAENRIPYYELYGHVMFAIRINTTKHHDPWNIDECIDISAKSMKINLPLI